MNILFCIPDEVEYDGENYYSNPISVMINRYSDASDTVLCIAPIKNVETSHSDLIENKNVKFLFSQKLNSIKALCNWKNYNHKIKSIVEKSDVCIIHVHASFVSNLTFDIAYKLNKPILTVVCGCPWDALWNYNLKGKFLAPIAACWLKSIQKRTKYSIYVTSEFLQKRYPTSGNQIDCSNVEIESTDFDLNARTLLLKQKDRRKRIATIAAVDVKYKGQHYVIKALKKLRNLGIEFDYYIVGGGDSTYLRNIAIKYKVEDLVHFTGPIKHSEIFRFLDTVDIYIQPSKQEGLPRSVIEAMSRGCLCMGSNIAGIPELIDSKFLFAPGNIAQIVNILKGITVSDFEVETQKNITKSEKYNKSALDSKRNQFLVNFKNNVQI